jgi:hypothetical protein
MTKPIIPFSWLPASWGLKGKTRDIAKAEYELSGYELEKRLIELNTENENERSLKINELDFNTGRISQEKYSETQIDLMEAGEEKSLKKIDHDFKFKKISENDRNKLRADVLGEPWVNIIKISMSDDNPSIGSFELDWNDEFVECLRKHGYDGVSDEQVIDQWVNTLCKHIALEEFDGHGSMDALSSSEIIKKRKIDDDRWGVK